jgi:hypothetical protein
MEDKLITCNRCDGNACYQQHIDANTTTWLCLGCGFTTSTLMKEESKLAEDLKATSPELYKDLLFVDENKNVWVPSTITLPGKGMVFVDGNNKSNWVWSAVKAIPITEEDRKLKQYPEDQEFKMDMANAKQYNKKDFMDAIEDIGFFAVT